MATNNKLMDMLTGYAASHQHPFNILVHMIGIPTIMLGAMIPLTWVTIDLDIEGWGVRINPAYLLVFGFFVFYMTLDRLFAIVFLVFGAGIAMLAAELGEPGMAATWPVAAALFIGGYIAQFVGHAVEKSMPVLVRHPIQANLAAPFFTVVELFKILGLRDDLFNAVQREIAARREAEVS